MNILIAIKYIAVLLTGLYLAGLLIVWIFEFKKNNLYSRMQKRLKLLEGMRLSTALGYAKAYKIKHDYRREIEPLERVQKFILIQVLFMAKTQNKTGKGWL
ncbi:MAG: hypothetical protein ACD_5C00226G0003 [uncultured bacterium]|nr:MAG: hypothetical protein ACD_5C00226G0003 [uncultured bacterium]